MKRISIFALMFITSGLLLCGCGNNTTESSYGVATEAPTEPTISVINVTDMTLTEAMSALGDIGLENVTSDIDKYDGWDKDKLIVVEQSIKEGEEIHAADEVSLTCKRLCQFYIDVKSEGNLILNTYDMDIYLDDLQIGTVANGKEFTYLIEVLEGKHTLCAYKA